MSDSNPKVMEILDDKELDTVIGASDTIAVFRPSASEPMVGRTPEKQIEVLSFSCPCQTAD